MAIIIADSGSTKCEWTLVNGKKKKTIFTMGISPYFLNELQIKDLVEKEVKPAVRLNTIDAIYYYGTGCKSAENRKMIRKAIKKVFPETDMGRNCSSSG